jgi:hypothetical protein
MEGDRGIDFFSAKKSCLNISMANGEGQQHMGVRPTPTALCFAWVFSSAEASSNGFVWDVVFSCERASPRREHSMANGEGHLSVE